MRHPIRIADGADRDLHVVPIRDLREHAEARSCWCEPTLEDADGTAIVIHRAEDGRELVEQHGLQ